MYCAMSRNAVFMLPSQIFRDRSALLSPQCAAVSRSSRNPVLSNAQSVLNDGGTSTAPEPPVRLWKAAQAPSVTASIRYHHRWFRKAAPLQLGGAAQPRKREVASIGYASRSAHFHFPEKALSNVTGRPRRIACHDIGFNRMAEIRAGVRSASLSVKTSMAPMGLVEVCIFLAQLP